MIKIILLIAAFFIPPVFADKPAQNRAVRTDSSWTAANMKGKLPTPVYQNPGDIATLTFPGGGATTLAFLTTTGAIPLGDLSGRSIRAEFSIRTFGSVEFVYWGWNLSGVNPCPRKANVRLFFTTDSRLYNYNNANRNEDGYWWSNPISVDLAAMEHFVLLETLADPSKWSNALGHWGNDPAHINGFYAATKNIRRIGLAFAGGCFFDVGVGTIGSGSATFHLHSYTAN